MQRGNLVTYDMAGVIYSQTGEAEGNVLPHVYPVGIPYLEISFGTMATKRLVRIDTTTEPHTPVFEDLPIQKTAEEQLTEYEAILRANGLL